MKRILYMVLRNIFIVPFLYLKVCYYAKHTDKISEEKKMKLLKYIVYRANKGGNVTIKSSGIENIPKEGSFMLFPNHQGMYDVLAIIHTCPYFFSAVMKKELKGVPFVEQIRLCTNSFLMDREDLRQSMTVINNVIKEVKAGRNYLIFPEGTRSRKGNELLEFHNGSFKCALKTKAPVLPVAFINSFKVMDEKGCKPVNVQIHYLKPIYFEEYEGMNTVELASLVRSRIEEVVKTNVK